MLDFMELKGCRDISGGVPQTKFIRENVETHFMDKLVPVSGILGV